LSFLNKSATRILSKLLVDRPDAIPKKFALKHSHVLLRLVQKVVVDLAKLPVNPRLIHVCCPPIEE
jgi:hypothetical protein